MSFEGREVVANFGTGMLPQAVIDDFFANKSSRKNEIEAMKLDLEKEELLKGL